MRQICDFVMKQAKIRALDEVKQLFSEMTNPNPHMSRNLKGRTMKSVTNSSGQFI